MSAPPSRDSCGVLNKELLQGCVKRNQAQSTAQQAGVPAEGIGGQGSPSGPTGERAQIHLLGDLIYSSSGPPLDIPVSPDIRDHHARAALRAIVDKQIDDSELSILSMRTRHNALVPISTLPPELLARIFHLHALYHPPFTSGKPLGWIVDTHVCRHWRQVALGDGSLWGGIKGFPAAKSKWVYQMVVRSKGAPLDFSFLELPGQRVLDLLLCFFPRIRELALRGLLPYQVYGDFTLKILTHKAPILERFTLGSTGGEKKVASPIVPGRLFEGYAPRLREITLYGVNLPWASFPRSPLTHLAVMLSPGAPSTPGAFEHLMNDVLSGCPTLELLSLHHCLPSAPLTLDQVSAVGLPRLRRLDLMDTSNGITGILEHLKLPPSSSLDIHCVNPSPTQGNLTSVLPFIKAHFARQGAVTLRSLYVTQHASPRHLVDITAYGTLPGPEGHPSSHDSDLDLHFEVKHDPGVLSDMVQQAFAALPFVDVEYHDVLAWEELWSLDWPQLHCRCNKIAGLSVTGRGTITLLRGINPPTAAVPPKPSGSNTTSRGKGQKKRQGREVPSQAVLSPVAQLVPFPELASLYVRDIDLSQRPPGGGGTVFNIVRNAMDRRKRCGMQLEKLEISGCIITANQARQLGKFAREFEWDEDEGRPEHPCYPISFRSEWD